MNERPNLHDILQPRRTPSRMSPEFKDRLGEALKSWYGTTEFGYDKLADYLIESGVVADPRPPDPTDDTLARWFVDNWRWLVNLPSREIAELFRASDWLADHDEQVQRETAERIAAAADAIAHEEPA